MKFSNAIRDITLFGMLLLLINIAFDRTKNFVAEHKESIVHELDQNFIDYLYTTQRHLHTLEQQELTQKDANVVAELKSKLGLIEKTYKKNSPALAFLGPIGTTAVVTKEAELEEKLTKIANTIGTIIHNVHNKIEPFVSAQTISEAIENNKMAIKQFVI